MKDYAFLFLLGAAGLDIVANLLLQKSDGFRKLRYGLPALLMVCVAFTLLAQATDHMDLTVAYVSWGAIAIVGTALMAKVFLGQGLNRRGWLGIAMILCSIVLLKTA